MKDPKWFEEMEARIPEGEVRTRFAPSPTGYMHVGNLRTALYTYLGSLTVEERRNLPLALVGLIFLHFYPCYCVDTICPNIV